MFNSIRTRLTLWFTGVLAFFLILFVASAYLFLKHAIRRQTDNTLQEISRTFAGGVEREQENGEEAGAPQNAATLETIREATDDLRFKDYQIFVFDAQKKIVSASDNAPDKTNLSGEQIAESAIDFPASEESAFFNLSTKENDFRVYAEKIAVNGRDFRIFVVHALDDEEELLEKFRGVLLISVPLALILSGFGGYFLARKSLSPVVSMSETASKIGATNLHERLPVKNEKDELGSLATIFNSLLDRLENSFEQQRRFMADASHELRTPLAIVRGESEVTLSKENRPNAELRESLAIVHDESKRLTRIVEDLFTLARADAGQFKTKFREIYLDELLADSVRAVRVLAERRDISLELSAPVEMPMRGDEQLLRRLFVNLLDNAIKYNRDGGKVSVRGEKTNGLLKIQIADTGAGIQAGEQSHIFERFYRADKARSRSEESATSSGAGLGLSIARWIAELHQGSVELVSSDKCGSTFAVTFPAEKFTK
ncbi:MAG: sensor histidine kinase [Pyrinomonadaceae bacterium]